MRCTPRSGAQMSPCVRLLATVVALWFVAIAGGAAAELDLHLISDLTRHAPSLVMGGDYEFFARPEWQAIRDTYALEFAGLRTMASALCTRPQHSRISTS